MLRLSYFFQMNDVPVFAYIPVSLASRDMKRGPNLSCSRPGPLCFCLVECAGAFGTSTSKFNRVTPPITVLFHFNTLRLQIVSKDREFLASRVEAAIREQANGTPLNQVTMTLDAACQIRYATPLVHPHTHAAERRVISLGYTRSSHTGRNCGKAQIIRIPGSRERTLVHAYPIGSKWAS